MTRDSIRTSVAVILAQARANHYSSGKRAPTADSMYHAAACKVDVSFTQADRPQLREPAAAPGPVGENGVDERRDEEAIDTKGCPFPAFRHCSSWNSGGGVHEHHLEEEHHSDPNI